MNREYTSKTTVLKNNTGSSLVEVIVSMLILVIIVVPLLNMFVTSAKINKTTRLQQYATTVAENIMEEIKSGKYAVPANQTGVYVTEVPNLLQGTGTFKANISYDPTKVKYDTKNDYKMPNISTFSDTNTVILTVDFTADEPMIANFFFDLHKVAVEIQNDALEMAATQQYWTDWNIWFTWKPEEHGMTPQGPEPQLSSYTPTTVTPMTLAQITSDIHRSVTVSFDRNLSTNEIRVNAAVSYTLPDTINIGQTTGTKGEYATNFYTSNWYKIADLQNLYILYKPFDSTTDATGIGVKEEVFIDLEAVYSSNSFNTTLYLATQGATATGHATKTTIYLSDITPENKAKFKIYNQTGLQLWYAANKNALAFAGDYNHTLVPLLNAEDRVFEVTVTIKEQSGTDTLAEVTSTLYY